MMKPLVLLATLCVVWLVGVNAALIAEQPFVVVGHSELEAAIAASPTLDVPTILVEVSSESAANSDAQIDLDSSMEAELEAEVGLVSPFIQYENQMIAENQKTLTEMELLAQQLGAPVLSDMFTEKAEQQVGAIEHSLIAQEAEVNAEERLEKGVEHVHNLEAIPLNQLLDDTPFVAQANAEATDEYLNLVELNAEVSTHNANRIRDQKAHDYKFMDDPKHGGKPTILRGLNGLDIYVVNTPVQDNENEIRPVPPPRPMSADAREKARLAELRRKELIHDIPQPKASIKPRTRINTMSAYEPSLADSRPVNLNQRQVQENSPFKRLSASLNNPMVGGHGALQMTGSIPMARFQQLGLEQMPTPPPSVAAAGVTSMPQLPALPVVAGSGPLSSFDNRDGPPVLLDEILPLKAVLVEELEPEPQVVSKPNW